MTTPSSGPGAQRTDRGSGAHPGGGAAGGLFVEESPLAGPSTPGSPSWVSLPEGSSSEVSGPSASRAVAAELTRLRDENTRLRRLLDLSPDQAAPAEPAQGGLTLNPPGPVTARSPAPAMPWLVRMQP